MRAILALAFAAVLAAGAGYVGANTVQQGPAVSSSAGQPPSQSAPATGFRDFADAYRSHRARFAEVSDYSNRVRSNRLAGLLAFAGFVLLTVPFNIRGVRAFYRQMMETAPLARQDGVSEENNRQARKVLFFYLLFLLYQLVEYPLTFGHGNRVQFTADLLIQIGLVIAIAWSFHSLKRGMHAQWAGDSERQAKMDRWLSDRLAGLRIRWRDISKLALGVFVVSFTPVALSHVTGWLDAATAFGARVFGT